MSARPDLFGLPAGDNIVNRFNNLVVLCVLVALCGAAASAQEQPSDLTAQAALVFRASPGQGLTPPSQAAPAAVVSNFLQARGRSQALLDSLVTISEGPGANGLTHLHLEQVAGGLRVYGAYA
jgi:hypothetical protein